MSLKLVKMNEIKKNKWFQQAITMKTIIPESYNSNGAVLRCKQHLYILMIENIVPIYRLEYSETPFGSPGKNLAHISPKIVQGLCSSKFAVFLSPQRPWKYSGVESGQVIGWQSLGVDCNYKIQSISFYTARYPTCQLSCRRNVLQKDQRAHGELQKNQEVGLQKHRRHQHHPMTATPPSHHGKHSKQRRTSKDHVNGSATSFQPMETTLIFFLCLRQPRGVSVRNTTQTNVFIVKEETSKFQTMPEKITLVNPMRVNRFLMKLETNQSGWKISFYRTNIKWNKIHVHLSMNILVHWNRGNIHGCLWWSLVANHFVSCWGTSVRVGLGVWSGKESPVFASILGLWQTPTVSCL